MARMSSPPRPACRCLEELGGESEAGRLVTRRHGWLAALWPLLSDLGHHQAPAQPPQSSVPLVVCVTIATSADGWRQTAAKNQCFRRWDRDDSPRGAGPVANAIRRNRSHQLGAERVPDFISLRQRKTKSYVAAPKADHLVTCAVPSVLAERRDWPAIGSGFAWTAVQTTMVATLALGGLHNCGPSPILSETLTLKKEQSAFPISFPCGTGK